MVEPEAVDMRMLAAETVVTVLAQCHVHCVDTYKPDGLLIAASRALVFPNHLATSLPSMLSISSPISSAKICV